MIKFNLKKNVLSYLSFLFSLFYNFLYPQKRGLGIPVLYYHKVLPKIPKYDKSTVLLENFIRQMQHLRRGGYATISLEDLNKWLNDKKELPKNPILLTFDDGHYSVYKYVYPILEKYGMKATIFLTSNFINGNKNLEVVQTSCSSSIKNNTKALEDVRQNPDYYLPLSWNNVHFLKSRGYSFGSHTMNHTDLNKLSGLQLAKELKSSKKKIELKINKNIFALSYPFGEYDNKVINFLKNKTDYKLAFTSQYGFITKNMNKLELKRIFILGEDSLFVFKVRLRGFDFRTFIKNILKIKKFYRYP